MVDGADFRLRPKGILNPPWYRQADGKNHDVAGGITVRCQRPKAGSEHPCAPADPGRHFVAAAGARPLPRHRERPRRTHRNRHPAGARFRQARHLGPERGYRGRPRRTPGRRRRLPHGGDRPGGLYPISDRYGTSGTLVPQPVGRQRQRPDHLLEQCSLCRPRRLDDPAIPAGGHHRRIYPGRLLRGPTDRFGGGHRDAASDGQRHPRRGAARPDRTQMVRADRQRAGAAFQRRGDDVRRFRYGVGSLSGQQHMGRPALPRTSDAAPNADTHRRQLCRRRH